MGRSGTGPYEMGRRFQDHRRGGTPGPPACPEHAPAKGTGDCAPFGKAKREENTPQGRGILIVDRSAGFVKPGGEIFVPWGRAEKAPNSAGGFDAPF